LFYLLDGVPPNIEISEVDVQFELDRRKPGQSQATTQRKESDSVEFLSGVFEGKTTGTSLAMLIANKDQKSKDYSELKNIFRPGHADYTYLKKYGIRDHRGSGRASGRETAARVAAGAIAKKVLRDLDINIVAYTLSIGDISAKTIDYSVIEKNMVRTPDLEAAEEMFKIIDDAKNDGDSVGGVVEAVVHGCPPGIGDPVFNKLDAVLAHALISLGSVKGIEFGAGFKSSKMKGSEHNDGLFVDGDRVKARSNNAGGIIGGLSTGEDIILRLAVKPTSSISKLQQTVTVDLEQTNIEIKGRHDPSICPRIIPVVESMIALTLLDAVLSQKTIS